MTDLNTPTPAPLDLGAIIAAQQDQIDDLLATVEAQQRILDALVAAAGPALRLPTPERPRRFGRR
jgi:hypothetical protein